MINNGVFEILMHIPEEYKADFFSGNLYRIGTNLHDAKTGRIVAHLTEIGEPLDITGKIAKGIENATIAANNAAKTATLATQVTIGIGVGVILAVGVGIYLTNKSIDSIKVQMNKAQKELAELKMTIDDINDGIESQNDGFFTATLKNMETALEEKAIDRIPGYRDSFIEIAERSLSRCRQIIEKGKAPRLLETLKKYILMYYISMQSSIRCSLFINQFSTAEKYVNESCKQLKDLQKKYINYFKNSSSNVFFECPVETIAEIPTIKESLNLMTAILSDNISIIKQLNAKTELLPLEKQTQKFNLDYLEFEKESKNIIKLV